MCIAFKLIFELLLLLLLLPFVLVLLLLLVALLFVSVLMLFLYGFYELFIAIFNARVQVWPGQLPILSWEDQQLAFVALPIS